jgi:hypothetical protein
MQDFVFDVGPRLDDPESIQRHVRVTDHSGANAWAI